MSATEYLQDLKNRFRCLYVLSVNGRLLSKELIEEYFDLKDKMVRLYGNSGITHSEWFFNKIVKEGHTSWQGR